MERVRLVISGDVHGVGFRFTAIEIGRDLGLTGWVCNKPDGSVEIIAEGEKDKLDNLVIWAKKGPALARVDNMKVEWQKATGEFKYFEVNYQ